MVCVKNTNNWNYVYLSLRNNLDIKHKKKLSGSWFNENVNNHYYLHGRYQHILETLIGETFRRNTKGHVDKEVNIPEPIIENTFLDMNDIERIIYDSALNDNKKK